MTFPLPVKVAYCLFCLCVHLFPGGEGRCHFFIMIFISLNIFVYLLFSPAIGFVAFSCFSSLSYRLFGSSMSVAYI